MPNESENDKVPYCCKCYECKHFDKEGNQLKYPYHAICYKHHYEAIDAEISILKKRLEDAREIIEKLLPMAKIGVAMDSVMNAPPLQRCLKDEDIDKATQWLKEAE